MIEATASFPTAELDSLPRLSSSLAQQAHMLATGKYGLTDAVLVENTARNLLTLVEAFAPEGPVLVVAGAGSV